ncbi:hypothetical protein CRG98_017726 [Punica granatum]|uniref:Uncharacterized protein n=1 Tax=Punica granatum TaxID=22663 RepID=A0A2I0K007_PUNGR|nr:hypothetical protein CRG98_017726 [Punica granatum]
MADLDSQFHGISRRSSPELELHIMKPILGRSAFSGQPLPHGHSACSNIMSNGELCLPLRVNHSRFSLSHATRVIPLFLRNIGSSRASYATIGSSHASCATIGSSRAS